MRTMNYCLPLCVLLVGFHTFATVFLIATILGEKIIIRRAVSWSCASLDHTTELQVRGY